MSEVDVPGYANRRVLVTGGSRGIGHAIATRFAESGAEVLVTGTAAGGSGPAGSTYRAYNFLQTGELDTCVGFVRDWSPDILINNAGINKIASFHEIAPEDFSDILQVNLMAPFRLSQAAIPAMKSRGWGRIVNVSSIWGKISREYRASYSASKFALDGMTTALAAEVAKFGVLVNCVAPGFINTELTQQVLGSEGIEKLVGEIPARRLGTPEEVADFVVWLAGPENTYISGQNIAIDGGFTRV